MNLVCLEQLSKYEVQDWLYESIPELTDYQKEKIRDNEIVRFAPFKFMKQTKTVENKLLRITVIFTPFVLLVLVVGLPINFIITGRWGYNELGWYGKWIRSLGL